MLGANLVLRSISQYDVVAVAGPRHRLLEAGFPTLAVDLLQEGAVGRLLHQVLPDWVVNCAALADVDVCERDPELADRLNHQLPGALVSASNEVGSRLLHVSTDAVFDGRQGGYSEQDAPCPISAYGRSKLRGEDAVLAAPGRNLVVRVNFFGWSPSGRRSLAEFFVNSLRKGSHLRGFTDVKVSTVLVTHLCDTLLSMVSAGLCGLYHVAGPQPVSKYDLGVGLAREFGLDEGLIAPASVTDSGLRAARGTDLSLDSGKLAREVGPLPPWYDGVHVMREQEDSGYRARLVASVRPYGEQE